MKNKLNIRGRLLGAVAIVAASFIGATPITAFAGGPDCTCEHKCTADNIDPDCELCKYDYTMCEGKDPEETEPEKPTEPEEEKWGPLTPDGNMTLVDDYGSLEAGGKQFITVVTKSGNYFYIIIDRDDEGEETVHFLNMVDESDLLALMDEEEVDKYLAATGKEKPEETTEEPTEEPEPEPEEPVQPEPEKKKNPTGAMALILLLAIGGAGGYIYFTKIKTKRKTVTTVDPDADYNEDEDEYLASLPDDLDEDYELSEDSADEAKDDTDDTEDE